MKTPLLSLALMAIPFFGISQSYFSANFNDGNISNWTLYDRDGDGKNWETVALEDEELTPAISSYSYDNNTFSPLTPNNYIVSPPINLTGAIAPILKFKVKGQDPEWADEKYSVYISTTNTIASFESATALLTQSVLENGPGGVFYTKTIDLSAYAGQSQIYIAFRHHDSTDMFAIHIDDVSVAEAPTAAPNCPTQVSPANASTNLSYLTQILSWSAPTSGEEFDSYEIYLDKNANPTTLVGTVSGDATSYNIANLDPLSTYYWKVVSKNSIGASQECTVYSFTTSEGDYCEAGANSTSFEKITNVTFADINNPSTSTAGYENFTNVVGNVTQGSSHTFTATFSGSSYDDDQVMVWIDFNQDKDFNDEGENVLVTAKKKSPWTGEITIPANALTGNTRMRVRLHDSALSPNTTPCGNSGFGQVEDYTLNIGQLAVSDINKAKVQAYPNPVVDILKITTGTNAKSIEVYDLSGKLVVVQEAKTTANQVNMANLKTGTYLVKINTEQGTETVKVIKK